MVSENLAYLSVATTAVGWAAKRDVFVVVHSVDLTAVCSDGETVC